MKGNTGISLLFLLSLRHMIWLVNATTRPFYPPDTDPVPIVYEAGWTTVSAWMGAENSTLSHRVSIPEISST